MSRLVLGLLVSAAALSGAQRGTVRVTIVDSTGATIPVADARIASLGRSAHADGDGRVSFSDLPEGRIEIAIRKVGYHPATVPVTVRSGVTDSVRVVLAEVIVELDGVRISAAHHPFIQAFDRRRSQGVGTFITPREIAERRATVSSDIFRQVPVVRLVQTPNGLGIRFPSILSIRRSNEDCVPMLWIDGMRAPGMEIDEIRSGDITAVEVYRGASTVPMEFTTGGRTQCGAVVIWTKRYGMGAGKGK